MILQSLAYILMKQGKRDMSREETCELLKVPLQGIGTLLTPSLFLDHLESISSSLFLEREQGVYGFVHQTVQEYLAMIYMQEHHLEHELVMYIEHTWWRETILLFCAQADATAILEACMIQPLPSLEALTLAIDCAEEARTVQVEVKERLNTLLQQGVDEAGPERRHVIASALLKHRLQELHPFQESPFLDISLVTCVEYQLFLDDLEDERYRPDIWHQSTFPQGHGRDAVLGIRVEDAMAFCVWLTGRNQERQVYRLPREEERMQVPRAISKRLGEDTSYWETSGSVVWAHSGPSRRLIEQVFLAILGEVNKEIVSNSAFIHRTIVATHDHSRALALSHDFIRIRDLARDLAHDVTTSTTTL